MGNMKKDKTKEQMTSIKKVFFQVGEHVNDKVEKHIRTLKFLKKGKISKNDWLAAAIKEKLEHEEDFDSIPRSHHYNVSLDASLHQQLEKRILFIKKYRSFSSKQLFLEAIFEKLDREAPHTKKIVEQRHKEK